MNKQYVTYVTTMERRTDLARLRYLILGHDGSAGGAELADKLAQGVKELLEQHAS